MCKLKGPWVEVLTEMPDGVNIFITVNFMESNFLVEKLTTLISFGNGPDETGLWLAIQNSSVTCNSSPTLVFISQLLMEGKTALLSELVSGSSPEILYSWLVWGRQIVFICFEHFHTDIFLLPFSVLDLTPNSLLRSIVVLPTAVLLAHFCRK